MTRSFLLLLPLAALGAGILLGRSWNGEEPSRAPARSRLARAEGGGLGGRASAPDASRPDTPEPPAPPPPSLEIPQVGVPAEAGDEWHRLVDHLAAGPSGTAPEAWAFVMDTWLRLGRRPEAARVALQLLPTKPMDDALLSLLLEQAPAAILEHLRAVAGAEPENRAALSWLGRALLASGDPMGAYAPLLRALEGGLEAGPAVIALLRADPERARQDLLRIFGSPELHDDEVIGDVAGFLLAAGRRAEAAILFARALAIDPSDGEWLTGLLNSNRDQAEEHFRAVLKDSPSSQEALKGLGLLLLASGRDEEAAQRILASIRDYAKPLSDEVYLLPYERAAPELRRLAEGGSGRGGVWAALARLEAVEGKIPEAVEAYLRAAADAKDPSDILAELVPVDPRAAADALAAALRGPEASAEMRGEYARARLALGDRAGAAEAFRAAALESPSATEFAADWAKVDPAAAVAHMERVARSERDDETLGDLADAYEAAGAPERAFASFQQAHESDREDFEWMLGLARTGGARAIPILRAHLARAPDSSDAWGALALAHEKAGDSRSAHEAYERALRGGDLAREVYEGSVRVDPRGFRGALESLARGPDTTSGALWWALSLARSASGDAQGAAAARRNAARLDPEHYLRHR